MTLLKKDNSIARTCRFDVSHAHQLHVEINGNPDGIPVLFLHGGPGAGLNHNYLSFFDLQKFLVIGFDQRGCGRSTPLFDTEYNTTQLCLSDIESIRSHLNINQWYIFGGSWGATLALLYAIEYPDKVMGLVLRGTFLARFEDIQYFLSSSGAAATCFVQEFEKFTRLVNEVDDAQTICQRYFALMTSPDHGISQQAIHQWCEWELAIAKLHSNRVFLLQSACQRQLKSLALMECFYLLNHCFIPENYILDCINNIKHVPCYLIHGRYDMVCKASASYALHRKLPHSTLEIINDAGHSAQETGIMNCLKGVMQTISSP